MSYRSPLLDRPGAVPASGVDEPIAWHYGDPLREQRQAESGAGLVDESHRDVLIVPGADRLEWLHTITSQHLSGLADGQSTEALVLSPNGHVEQHWRLTEFDDQVWIDTEPGAGDEALAYLTKMRFLKRVEPTLVTADYAVLSLVGPKAATVLSAAPPIPGSVFTRPGPSGISVLVERPALAATIERLIEAGAVPIGSWAAAALRVADRQPRLGFDTDHRSLPHELGWIGTAVHLDKGCYRGQETVARIQNLGRPPRRLVLLQLSGDSEQLPVPGTAVEVDGRTVGFVGTSAQHYELGPIALAVLKRSVGPDARLAVGDQVAVIDTADAEYVPSAGFAGRPGSHQTSA